VTYDEAVRAADMFTAAMVEAGYPPEKPAWVAPEENGWGFWWSNGCAPEVENKARLLVAHSLGYRVSCTRCWIEAGRGRDLDRCVACRNGDCPYEHEALL
jgi:hypothetical protein